MLEIASMVFSKMKMVLLAFTKVCNALKAPPLPTNHNSEHRKSIHSSHTRSCEKELLTTLPILNTY